VQGNIEYYLAGTVSTNPPVLFPPPLDKLPKKLVNFMAQSSNPAVVGLRFTVQFKLNGAITTESQVADYNQYGWAVVWFLGHDTDEILDFEIEERTLGKVERFH
jgi:hypothetical protein